MQPRLKTQYRETVLPHLQKEFDYGNIMEVPKLEKIVVNTCLKEAITNMKILDSAAEEIGLITGQKPIITRARNSIANFKLREGMPLGAKVTLRSSMMWEFLDRLISVATPRIRDFRGINSKGFDGRGNYSLGIDDQTIFPEIDVDKVKRTQGMDITIVTSASNDDDAYELLKEFGMPFDGKR